MSITNPQIRPITPRETYHLRHTVLWPHKPLAHIQLENDGQGRHFGAFLNDENTETHQTDDDDDPGSEKGPVSIVSLFFDEPGAGAVRVRKFATAPRWQRQGIGSALLRHAVQSAAEAGASSIWCDARQPALAFYERLGFRVDGERFLRGGVPHFKMSRSLP